MKTLEELGISPWPWTFCMRIDKARCVVRNLLGKIIVGYTNSSNAHLIAAAPELYDALQRIIQASDDSAHDFPSWQKNLWKALNDARAALKLAGG